MYQKLLMVVEFCVYFTFIIICGALKFIYGICQHGVIGHTGRMRNPLFNSLKNSQHCLTAFCPAFVVLISFPPAFTVCCNILGESRSCFLIAHTLQVFNY